jgi:hypothetical protein
MSFEAPASLSSFDSSSSHRRILYYHPPLP